MKEKGGKLTEDKKKWNGKMREKNNKNSVVVEISPQVNMTLGENIIDGGRGVLNNVCTSTLYS